MAVDERLQLDLVTLACEILLNVVVVPFYHVINLSSADAHMPTNGLYLEPSLPF